MTQFNIEDHKKSERGKMKRLDFMALCGEMLIEPDMALEDPEIVQALRDRKPYDEVKQILIANM